MPSFEQMPSPAEQAQMSEELRAAFEDVKNKPIEWQPDEAADPQGTAAWFEKVEMVLEAAGRFPEIAAWCEKDLSEEEREKILGLSEGREERLQQVLARLHQEYDREDAEQGAAREGDGTAG